MDQKRVFTDIYNTNAWNGHWQTRDGYGSSLIYTQSIRASLMPFMRKWGTKTFLDASCGECKWITALPWPPDINYIGGEIVEAKIERLKQEYPSTDFRVLDIISDPLPAADMWMCRDTLFHFPFAAIYQTMLNFTNSNIKFLLLSHHPNGENRDISFSDFFEMNVLKEPFNFPPPLDFIDDSYMPSGCPERQMYLYDRETISRVLSEKKFVV